ncbi:putative ABC transport system permease protein [Thermostichus sp. MS-CIW-21]|jgi:putative ABC transport system permease protein|uniref:ABC transporter permease DevC n=1 Tax=unclassified Synechococcus TaxID=2626047 RepID=UPI00006945A1|nr:MULTISPECIES: ABC transporter permease DevC [unclassified Synechococcus]ABD00026.1 probable glycolipid ABC exporter (DevE) family, permease protein [Synechococcus sp. JA-3-3Ab]PIK87066.1 ABC transporter [Synechococcus sp. 63AY4M2]PIK87984.1 ABC transporter [Synechococcus sp. 65AY6A5]PIK92425.1 ABC transporter [Synechococcus sp. 65AY6Li]PIK96134.1 ABC transporter [Synechococcus sp. 60AY4M2]
MSGLFSVAFIGRRIPLAWLQLTREKIRLLVALAGIAFACILMFMQLGFQDSLLESAIRFHVALKGEIFLVSPQSNALIAMNTFSQRRLYQALGFEGVRAISPVYVGFALWKNPQTRRTRSIFVVGVDPSADLLELPELTPDKLEEIKKADVVLFDRRSRSEFGPIPEWFEAGREVFTEVGNRRVQVGGLFKMGATFGADGTILTSDLNFLRIFPQRERGLVDIGVVQLQPGVDPQPLVQQMRALLPEDVRVLSRAEFIDMEQSYWEEGTAIGFIFGLGVAMGFIVGIVIVYQILYTDVSDHLAEYATLKAMGYTDTYLLGVVFQEAILLAGLGYIPAFALAVLLYDLTANATLLPIAMTFNRAVLVLLLAVSMCFISGAIAVRRLRAADPADIF